MSREKSEAVEKVLVLLATARDSNNAVNIARKTLGPYVKPGELFFWLEEVRRKASANAETAARAAREKGGVA